MNTDRFLTIPAEEYHAASRSGRYMSSHLLADFRESPELYRRKTNGEIASADTQSLALGRAAHCLILEGRAAFDEQFLVADGPVNPIVVVMAIMMYSSIPQARSDVGRSHRASPANIATIITMERSFFSRAGGTLRPVSGSSE